MAELPTKYNTPDNKDSMQDFTALPAGEYISTIIKSQYKKTKAGTGHYLQLQFKIVEGTSKGRMFFENLNLDNPNPIAVEIANKTLNSICQGCDKTAVENSEELHGIPMKVTLKVNAATAVQPASNSAIKFEAYSGEAIPDMPETETADASADKPGVTKKLPWEA